MLGYADGLEAVVVSLLVILAVDLDPARVAAAHGVLMVAVDVDGAGQRAVDRGHHDGKPIARGDEEHLPHQGEPLRRGGRHGAHPCGRRADDRAHGRVLRFHRDELGIDLAVGDHLGVDLDDLGLRSYRIGAHHVGIDLPHGLGHGLVACDGDRVRTLGSHRLTPSLPLPCGWRRWGTPVGAYAAALAVIEIEAYGFAVLDYDRGVGAVEVAEHAPVASLGVQARYHRPPAACEEGRGVARRGNDGPELVPVRSPGINVADVPGRLRRARGSRAGGPLPALLRIHSAMTSS